MADERILIVEDEAITGMDIREMVRIFGYEPHGPVVSGQAAVASALALRPDLILMDIMLKGPMNGIHAARAIRAQYRCPVIYLTGSSDQIRADLAQVAEPFGLVLKPIGEQELHAAIKMALHPDESTPGCPSYAMLSEVPERMSVQAAGGKPTSGSSPRVRSSVVTSNNGETRREVEHSRLQGESAEIAVSDFEIA